MLQESLIERCYILACSTVYEYAIENIHSKHLVAKILSLCLWCFKQFAIIIQVDTIAIENSSL